MSSNGNTYFASMGFELELLYTCITTTLAQRSNNFALIWTHCNGTKLSPSNLNPGFTLSNGSSRFSMSDVVMLGMFSSSSDEMACSSSETAVVGSQRIFSLERHYNFRCRTVCVHIDVIKHHRFSARWSLLDVKEERFKTDKAIQYNKVSLV